MASQARPARKRITLERTYDATLQEVWDLWTTKEGIEAWWGPDGFEVRVRRLDLRPGGSLEYVMTATGPDQIDFLKKAGMPVVHEHQLSYSDVAPHRRLAFADLADFIPGVQPYTVQTEIDFEPAPRGVRVVVAFEAMHDDHWTRLAVMGRESELDRLAQLLERRRQAPV